MNTDKAQAHLKNLMIKQLSATVQQQSDGIEKPIKKHNHLPDLSSIENKDNVKEKQFSQKEEFEDVPLNEPTAVDSPEDIIYKKKLIISIQLWSSQFKKFLGNPMDLFTANYSSLSIEQLENLLVAIKYEVSVRNSTQINTGMFKHGMNQLENLLLYATPLKVNGLGKIGEDEDVLDTFKEFSLENMDLMYTKPAYRLGFSVISAIAQLHIKNTALDALKPKIPDVKIEQDI